MAAKKPTKRAKSKVAAFTVSLKVNGQHFTASGDSLKETLENLPQVKAKTKGVVAIMRDGFPSKELILSIPALNRLFYPGMTGDINRTVLAKRFDFFIHG